MSQQTLEKIRNLLDDAGISYREIQHEPTRTSEASAAARGESMRIGAKALLLKTDNVFRLFVLPADRKMNSTAIRRYLGVGKTRFATLEELNSMIGLVPGSVPPFGEPVLPFKLYADNAIGKETDKVAFNAGLLTHSIIMAASDWLKVARPEQFSFARE
jgi:prolyl-tRNA editing enzyme YbaK/EbsC (Cys-tRNA(Pro) deacylase)